MSIDFIFRLIGMVAFAIAGVVWGQNLGKTATNVPGNMSLEQYTFTFGLVGALVGLILTPYFTTRPVRKIQVCVGKIIGTESGGVAGRAGCGSAGGSTAIDPPGLSALPLWRVSCLWCGVAVRLPGHFDLCDAPGRPVRSLTRAMHGPPQPETARTVPPALLRWITAPSCWIPALSSTAVSPISPAPVSCPARC